MGWRPDRVSPRLRDLEFEIHYDVNAVTVRRPNFCTEAEVCVGSPFTAVEQAYGLGQISTEGLEPDQTRRVEYLIVGGGYCTAAFTFASDTSGVESVQEISTYCLPD